MLPYDKRLKANARKLRGAMTDTEQKLWQRLCRKQINGWQFYRQKPLGPYIVDFYCPAAGLVVEIDGSQHFEPAHQLADQRRDAYLAGLGLRVLRFDNRQVLQETEAVLDVIRIPPAPPFSKGGVSRLPINVPPSSARGQASHTPTNPIAPVEKGALGALQCRDRSASEPIPPFEKGGFGGIDAKDAGDGEVEP